MPLKKDSLGVAVTCKAIKKKNNTGYFDRLCYKCDLITYGYILCTILGLRQNEKLQQVTR